MPAAGSSIFCVSRPVYLPPVMAAPVMVTDHTLPQTNASPYTAGVVQSAPTPVVVDYVAKDRQIKSLQSQIDDIDDRIAQIRSHPNDYTLFGTYNGNGYRVGEESPLKKMLDQLDKQRNDLRRQKWQLEGR